jgi:cephalosporin-C deacetylase-like acetyl esterase
MVAEDESLLNEEPIMKRFSRRDVLYLSLAASSGLTVAADEKPANVHEQILDLAARQQEQRRARFAAVKSKTDLESLQKSLREKFLRLIGGLPEAKGAPPVKKTGEIVADDYVIEKLVYESYPGYFVSALLYRPKKIKGPLPGVLSPCGHAPTGKAADSYQILHVNLAKRGYVVLTYDPVGQGERSQFWDTEKEKSRFNLSCGEHAVLGNPLYLLGSSLARFRIWDGLRGLDYLAARPEVDPKRIGCVGNSGGGTLTAYISALDPRVSVAAICCYITTLPRRMGNRIQTDPDADPEQDIFGFVGEGIDHAGLLALRTPRPTLLGTARFDFFPIEGARESFAEAKKLYEVAGAGERIERAEAEEKHGLTLPLRKAVYGWFERWLADRKDASTLETAMTPRPAKELLVSEKGQVNVSFRSRSLLPLALEELKKQKKPAKAVRDLLGLDPALANFYLTEIAPPRKGQPLLLCVNGNEGRDWREEKDFLNAVAKDQSVVIVDPRGAGKLRSALTVKGRDYADPLNGVEENIAYNAFLVGKSLLGMRVADVLASVKQLTAKASKVVLCGRRDASLVVALAAAVESSIKAIATEEMLLSYLPLFAAEGHPINAASILPGMLRDFGDVVDVLAAIAPRRMLLAAGVGELPRRIPTARVVEKHFSRDPRLLTEWIADR